jgi:hypothetical protein
MREHAAPEADSGNVKLGHWATGPLGHWARVVAGRVQAGVSSAWRESSHNQDLVKHPRGRFALWVLDSLLHNGEGGEEVQIPRTGWLLDPFFGRACCRASDER